MRWTLIYLAFITLIGCAEDLPSTPVEYAPANDTNNSQAQDGRRPKADSPTNVAPEDIVYFFDSTKLQDGVPDVDEGAAERDFKVTDSGLKYRILKTGDGPNPTADDRVEVHYRGWLDNGEVFDGSFGGSAATFGLRGVVAGWTEGIPLVAEGGVIELVIPSALGYGSRGAGNTIPPNATLHFVVQLIDIK